MRSSNLRYLTLYNSYNPISSARRGFIPTCVLSGCMGRIWTEKGRFYDIKRYSNEQGENAILDAIIQRKNIITVGGLVVQNEQ